MENNKQNDETIVHIGQIVPLLANLTVMAPKVILDGFKLAFLNRYVMVQAQQYRIAEIFIDPTNCSKIMAKLVKVVEEQAA